MTRVLVALAVVASLSACSVPTGDDPVAIPANRLPPELSPSTPPPTTTAPVTAPTVLIYLLNDRTDPATLAPVDRSVEDITIGAALDALVETPPTEEERDAGLSNAWPENPIASIEVRRDDVDDSILIIEFMVETPADNDNLRSNLLSNERPVAQLVFTATEFGAIDEVLFEINDEAVSVATSGVSDATPGEPVDRCDYRPLIPEPGAFDTDCPEPTTTTSPPTTTTSPPTTTTSQR